MGKRNTFTGYVRAQGDGGRRDEITPVPLAASKKISVADASQAAGTATDLKLPKGAIVTRISLISGVTGGTSPTVNIGVNFAGGETDDPDGLAANIAADASSVIDVSNGGALFGEALAERGTVTVGTGTGTSGTGGVDLIVEYTFDDDGVVNN